MIRHAMAALLAAATWAASSGVRPASAQTPSTLASKGVYTKAQASRGGNLYTTICVACHSLGRFKGADFVATWSDKPLALLYKAVKSMPLGEPQSLEPQEYADVGVVGLAAAVRVTAMTDADGPSPARHQHNRRAARAGCTSALTGRRR